MRTEIKDNILYYNYKNSNDEIIESSCDLENISEFYIKKLEAIASGNQKHQRDMKKTAKEILKVFEDKIPEYFI